MSLTLPYAVDPAVPVLVRALRDRGLHADVQVMSVCGEPDVRLVICRKGAGVSVELLASLAVDRPADRWDAVRVRGDDRQVWRGPQHDAPTAQVVLFVEALLTGTDRVPYPRLG